MSEPNPKWAKLPDLPDIMDAGLGLTEALAWWSFMMNQRDRTPLRWWCELECTAETIALEQGKKRQSDLALH